MILALRVSLVKKGPQARMDFQVYQVFQAFGVIADKASQVGKDYQDFPGKRVILVQLVCQELDYQEVMDLVDFLEIKE